MGSTSDPQWKAFGNMRTFWLSQYQEVQLASNAWPRVLIFPKCRIGLAPDANSSPLKNTGIPASICSWKIWDQAWLDYRFSLAFPWDMIKNCFYPSAWWMWSLNTLVWLWEEKGHWIPPACGAQLTVSPRAVPVNPPDIGHPPRTGWCP